MDHAGINLLLLLLAVTHLAKIAWAPFPSCRSYLLPLLRVQAGANYAIYMLWDSPSLWVFNSHLFACASNGGKKLCKCTCVYACVCVNVSFPHTWKVLHTHNPISSKMQWGCGERRPSKAMAGREQPWAVSVLPQSGNAWWPKGDNF